MLTFQSPQSALPEPLLELTLLKNFYNVYFQQFVRAPGAPLSALKDTFTPLGNRLYEIFTNPAKKAALLTTLQSPPPELLNKVANQAIPLSPVTSIQDFESQFIVCSLQVLAPFCLSLNLSTSLQSAKQQIEARGIQIHPTLRFIVLLENCVEVVKAQFPAMLSAAAPPAKQPRRGSCLIC